MSAALQSVLTGRFADLLQFREKLPPDTLPSGIPGLDFPRGAVTEIHGPASSGRASLLLSALAQATASKEVCALIDVDDSFDPASAAPGVALSRLLWIRCGHNAERDLKVTDLIVQGGGFGMVAMDLGGTPPETARRIPPGEAQDRIVLSITAFALYGFPESHAASFAGGHQSIGVAVHGGRRSLAACCEPASPDPCSMKRRRSARSSLR